MLQVANESEENHNREKFKNLSERMFGLGGHSGDEAYGEAATVLRELGVFECLKLKPQQKSARVTPGPDRTDKIGSQHWGYRKYTGRAITLVL